RTRDYAASPYTRLQFEDTQPGEVFALALHEDVASTDHGYIDADLPKRSILKPIALGLITLVIAGFLYERFGDWRDRRRYPQIGRSYDIGGRSLNLFCSGEGSPTAIFISNWGDPGFSWMAIQREVAKFTRACWYDRAGYGWSDPGPFPHHSDLIAQDLQALLKAAQVDPPYIVVGHSLGSF